MKRLLNNWWGRLYLVVQICVIITSFILAVDFLKQSQSKEYWNLLETRKNHGEFEYSEKGQTMPPTEAAKLDMALEWTHKSYREVRRDKILKYLGLNFSVPIVFAVGLFIGKGFPKRKSTAMT
jgi:hypothetical protein